MPVNSVPAMGWTRRSAAISVLLVCEEQRKRAGVRVVQLREAKGWSQETLAQKAGLSTKTVSRFENGVHEGRTGTVQKLAKALGVNQYEVTGPPPAPLGLGTEPEPPQDALADRFDALEERVTRQLDKHARGVETQLGEQNNTLAEMKQALIDIRAGIAEEQRARKAAEDARRQAEEATKELRGLLDVLAVAIPTLAAGAPPKAAKRVPRAK